MKFECYTNWAQLPEHANVLFAQAEKDSVFFSRPWFESLTFAALDDDQKIMLACVEDGDKVMAILPLMTRGGKACHSLRHGFSPLFTLLLANDNQQQVLACLAQGLSQLSVTGFLLEPVSKDDSKLNGLKWAMETTGFNCDYTFRAYNWIYRLQGQSYREYIAGRPTSLRNTIARKQRKLEREHGYQIKLFKGDDALQHMSDYYAVYNASWKQNEINNAGFLHSFVTRFSKKGWARLAILYVNEQPVAAQLWFVCNGKASIFRLAYDKTWRNYSIGSILTNFLMEYVIEIDKVSEVDFLTGNDAYKQDWMSERNERYVLSCIKKKKTARKDESVIKSKKSMLQRLFRRAG